MKEASRRRAGYWLLVGALALSACGSPPTPPGVDSGAPVYGAACTAATGCGPGLSCLTEFPGGYCTSVCDGAACGTGGVCDRALAPNLCTDECTNRSDCREGYQCWRGGCVPACTDDLSCGMTGATCSAGQCEGAECVDGSMCPPGWDCLAGVCTEVPDAGPVLLADGQPCVMDPECQSGVCLPPARGGVCSRACVDALDCSATVRFSSSCAPVTRGGAVGTYCIPFNGSGVAVGEVCAAATECQSSTCVEGICTEACDATRDCTYGLECAATPYEAGSFSGCRFPSGNPYEVTIPDIALDAGFGTSLMRMALPADVASVTLQVRHVSGDPLAMGFYEVTQRGTTFFDLEGLYDWVDQPNRWIPNDSYEVANMGVPNARKDRGPPGAGPIRFGVLVFTRMMGDTGRATVAPSALVRRGADPGTGVLDVAVHLVGVGVAAAAAPTDTRVQALLTRLGELLGGAGIRLGARSYHDVSSSTLSVIDSADGIDSELAQLFRMSAGRSGRVLSLFLVRSIETGGEGFNTLGIAGGIPGPVGVHGTMHSGVVVAFDAGVVGGGAGGGRLAGHISTHEGGHYLGLFHVTERIRACAGAETPETATCMPFGGGDPLADTTYGDTGNLMNWSLVGSGTNTFLSPEQGYVLRRSGLVSWP